MNGMDILIGGGIGIIGTALILIVNRLCDISTSLEKIARNGSNEIKITVPGNKLVRVDLPDGGIINQTITKEARGDV